ncbi:alcohol dehydrogenase catalytic domain-containing protein [Streptomyces virginiae]
MGGRHVRDPHPRHGGPEVLSVREIPQPTPGVGVVLIRTVAGSLNPMDRKTRAWEVGPQLPATLGWDQAGVVTASNHSRCHPGDQVIAMSAGRSAAVFVVRGLPAHQIHIGDHLLGRGSGGTQLPCLLASSRKVSRTAAGPCRVAH